MDLGYILGTVSPMRPYPAICFNRRLFLSSRSGDRKRVKEKNNLGGPAVVTERAAEGGNVGFHTFKGNYKLKCTSF